MLRRPPLPRVWPWGPIPRRWTTKHGACHSKRRAATQGSLEGSLAHSATRRWPPASRRNRCHPHLRQRSPAPPSREVASATAAAEGAGASRRRRAVPAGARRRQMQAETTAVHATQLRPRLEVRSSPALPPALTATAASVAKPPPVLPAAAASWAAPSSAKPRPRIRSPTWAVPPSPSASVPRSAPRSARRPATAAGRSAEHSSVHSPGSGAERSEVHSAERSAERPRSGAVLVLLPAAPAQDPAASSLCGWVATAQSRVAASPAPAPSSSSPCPEAAWGALPAAYQARQPVVRGTSGPAAMPQRFLAQETLFAPRPF
mmetsp:Transcript_167092/g.536608  ORF Transcript_167092/g.536608 Transcript_167092/m.536608 type:complete len:318 (+) Transcript_167092:638-1591(+)